MRAILLSFAQGGAEPWTPGAFDWGRSLAAVAIVLALAAGCAWLLRRGAFGAARGRGRQRVSIETVALLGERRSLVVATVEGRRLLLGLTPASVSLVTELAPAATFADRLDAAGAPPPETRS